jgi:hypothetical protein
MSIDKITSRLNWAILGALIFVVHSGCFASDESTMKIARLEGGYSVRVPYVIKTTQISTVEDFMLYSMVDLHGKVVLQVYVGNHPQALIKHKEHAVQSTTVIGGFSATLTQWPCAKRLFCGDVRIRLLDGEGWPSFAHMSYKELSKSELDITQNIINSFRKD